MAVRVYSSSSPLPLFNVSPLLHAHVPLLLFFLFQSRPAASRPFSILVWSSPLCVLSAPLPAGRKGGGCLDSDAVTAYSSLHTTVRSGLDSSRPPSACFTFIATAHLTDPASFVFRFSVFVFLFLIVFDFLRVSLSSRLVFGMFFLSVCSQSFVQGQLQQGT